MSSSEIRAEERKAIALEESGQQSAALEIWLRLARERPTAAFHCRAAGVLQSLGRFDEAEAAFREAHALDPLLPQASLGLALSLIKQHKLDAALDALNHVAKGADEALALSLRGHALKGLGRIEEALQAFRKAAELDPNYDEAFLNIGLLLRGVDDEGAGAALRKAVELDADCAEAHRELGWIERKAEKLSSAEQHLRRATELSPDDTWAWVYLGNLLWRAGKFSDAEDAFQKAYDHAPEEWYPNWELACFYEDRKDYGRAARFYHKALLASPDQPVLLFHYGRFLSRQGDRETAEKYLRRACEAEPEYEEARRLLQEVTGRV